MKSSKTHTEPVICPKEPKDSDMKKSWFILVRFYDPETKKWIPKRWKQNINRYHEFPERLQQAEDLQKEVTQHIANGYHPYIKKEEPVNEIIYTFHTGLDYAMTLLNVSETTKRNYRCAVKYIKEAAEVLRLHSWRIRDIKRKQIKQILEQCRRARKWSGKAYNKNLGYLKAVLSILVEWEEIEYNPAHKIRTLEVEETQKFVPYTEDEKKRIKDYLFLNDYRFFVFVMVIFHCGLRPMEILALKIKDIDFANRLINILPSKERKNSKTKKRREVPMNDFIFRFLREHVEGYSDPELFVFGSPFESGKGNRGTGSPTDIFKPSYTRIKRDTVTKRWKAVVMHEKGLNINKHLYSAKHSGADSKILAGISVDALQSMYGHSSTQMTEKYITALKGIHQKQIIELSPDF